MTAVASPRPRRAIGRALSWLALAGTLAACGIDPGVVTVSASRSDTAAPVATVPTGGSTVPTEPPSPTEPGTTAPLPTAPPEQPMISEPELLVDIPIDQVVDIGDGKPARPYDDFVAVAFSDIQRWWNEQYPAVYGEPFEPLAGGIFAGYPGRSTPLPGCGEPSTSYQDLNQFAAFYCQIGDFMMYDDGDDSLLAALAGEFGDAVMGVVLAHEYGHAIQSRSGVLNDFTATIYTEQQADCFSGAWVAQAYQGQSPMLRLGDADVRAGLIAMLEVRDPVGTNQFVPGGHGSAFDRVGAFQEGFTQGPARCAELIDDPLPLMPNEFRDFTDQALGGNAPYDCEELRDLGATDEEIANCSPAPEFLAEDLNDFWQTELGTGFPTIVQHPADSISGGECTDSVRLGTDVELCPLENEVVYDEPDVLDLYRSFGDFTLGYLYGIAWAERAQELQGSTLVGEQRALLNDCYTGAWVRDITPDPNTGFPQRAEDTDGDGRLDTAGVTSSPGDLDEAIRMAILVGDTGAADDVVGSAFEKIASFRTGVLGGLDACAARFDG